MKTRTTPTGAAITPSEIRDLATPLTDDASLDPLQASIGDARFVLLGEASHGTAEYYRWGVALTQRLICRTGLLFRRRGRRLARLLPGERPCECSDNGWPEKPQI